jgi:hypothetical protein
MVARRGFLGRLAAAALAATGAPRIASATEAVSFGGPGPDDWLDRQTAPHRQFFDSPLHNTGLPLLHAFNYITTYERAYGVKSSEVNAVLACYGAPSLPASIAMAWNDAMWAKYRISELIGLRDANGGVVTRNVFYEPRAGDPVLFNGAFPQAGMKNLMGMGATFLMCNNAFMGWCNYMASQGRGAAADIEKDIRANLIPGVVTVPAMVIAIEKAQGKGIAYNRQ